MGFPGVVPEHVPGTLGEHCMFPVPCSLFPVLLRIPPPQKKNTLFPVPFSHKTHLQNMCSVFPVPLVLTGKPIRAMNYLIVKVPYTLRYLGYGTFVV